MVGSLIFGFGFTFLPAPSIKSLFEHLEVIYISLENLITIVNKSLPVVAAIFAVNIFSGIGQGWFGLVTNFLSPFLLAIVLAGLMDFLIIAYVAEAKLMTVVSALSRALVISFLARNPAAGVPEVITCLCDRFGFKRSLVRFLAPLFPIFFNAGEVIFFTLLSVFVANVYDQTLTMWSLVQILSLSVVCTFVSTTLVGGGSVVMATFMLQAFNLPFDALLPAFFVLEIFLAGAKSALSLLFACAVISLVSHGLSRESSQLHESPDESIGSNRMTLSIDKKMLLLLYVLFGAFLAIVFVIGLGVGARSVQTPQKPAISSTLVDPTFNLVSRTPDLAGRAIVL
jgi:Na+/H+-dicarboxylate symporter